MFKNYPLEEILLDTLKFSLMIIFLPILVIALVAGKTN